MTRLAFIASLALVAATPNLQAQVSATTLPPGSRVRVHQGGQSTTGTLLSVDSTSLTFVTGSADTVTAPHDSITRVEVSRGTRSRAGKGALIGLGVGAAAGIALGVVASADDSGFLDYSAGDYLKVGLFTGAVGALVGALIGQAYHSDRWQPVVLPAVSVKSAGSEGRRIALGLRIRF